MQSGRVFNGRPRRLLCTQSLSMGAAPPAPASASPAAAPATPAAAGAPPQPQRRLKSSSLMTWRQVGKQGTEKQGVGRPQGFVLPAVPLSQSAQHTRPPACQPACPPQRQAPSKSAVVWLQMATLPLYPASMMLLAAAQPPPP